MTGRVYAGNEPPYTERSVRWCERARVSHPPLLDLVLACDLLHRKTDMLSIKPCAFAPQRGK